MSEPAGIEVLLEFDPKFGPIWRLSSFLKRIRTGRIMVVPHLDYQIRDQGSYYSVRGHSLVTFANVTLDDMPLLGQSRSARVLGCLRRMKHRSHQCLLALSQQCLFLMYWAGLPYRESH